MNDKPILTICCSRNRISQAKEMYDSFVNTSKHSDIVFLLDDDDDYQEYYKIIPYKNTIVGKRTTITNRLNEVFSNFKDFSYYHITNDDVVYHIRDWDKTFINIIEDYGSGIVYGNDLFQKQNLPTFPFISGDIVRTLGWVQMPTLNKFYGDNVWQIIGSNCNILYYCPDIIIEHKTFFNGKAPELSNSEKKEYMRIYESDKLMFINWLVNSQKDIEKVREVCHHKSA